MNIDDIECATDKNVNYGDFKPGDLFIIPTRKYSNKPGNYKGIYKIMLSKFRDREQVGYADIEDLYDDEFPTITLSHMYEI